MGVGKAATAAVYYTYVLDAGTKSEDAFELEVIQVVHVTIDIKLGGDPKSVNPRSKSAIPVAILTTDDFDATTVDPVRAG